MWFYAKEATKIIKCYLQNFGDTQGLIKSKENMNVNISNQSIFPSGNFVPCMMKAIKPIL